MAQLVIGTNKQTVIPAIVASDGTTPAKYQLLQRIKDDNNVDIGIVSGFFNDGITDYAVVCLNAEHRGSNLQYLSENVAITNLPNWTNQTMWDIDVFHETATFATDKILAMTEDGTYTSSACTHCRSKSFVIEGTTYYGQLPNIHELVDIFKHRTKINAGDPTSGSVIPSADTTWSSTQRYSTHAWLVSNYGAFTPFNKSDSYFVVPILELPL